ncbi:hypothetical protein [Lysinibacillus phage vB_LspM-01]|nr:hypothetical protein [Lysinibacillus phage vB_LspM-01]
MIKSVKGIRPRFINTDRVSMFKDGLGKPIRLGDTIYINGHEMIVRYGKHVNDSTNWLFGANHNSREMYGWYAESPCGSWEVNLYSKKDQIESLIERLSKYPFHLKENGVLDI